MEERHVRSFSERFARHSSLSNSKFTPASEQSRPTFDCIQKELNEFHNEVKTDVGNLSQSSDKEKKQGDATSMGFFGKRWKNGVKTWFPCHQMMGNKRHTKSVHSRCVHALAMLQHACLRESLFLQTVLMPPFHQNWGKSCFADAIFERGGWNASNHVSRECAGWHPNGLQQCIICFPSGKCWMHSH